MCVWYINHAKKVVQCICGTVSSLQWWIFLWNKGKTLYLSVSSSEEKWERERNHDYVKTSTSIAIYIYMNLGLLFFAHNSIVMVLCFICTLCLCYDYISLRSRTPISLYRLSILIRGFFLLFCRSLLLNDDQCCCNCWCDGNGDGGNDQYFCMPACRPISISDH